MKVHFSDEGDMTHCVVTHETPAGPKQVAKGSVNKTAIIGVVRKAIAKHGHKKVAVALGCEDPKENYAKGANARGELDNETIPGIVYGIAEAVNQEAKCQALAKAAQSMGWSPFKLIKKAAWDYNPVVYAAKKSGQFAYGGLKAINPFKRGGGGGGGGGGAPADAPPEGGPEGPEDSTPDQDQQQADADAASGELELMQDWQIMGCRAGDGADGSDEPMAGSAGSTDNLFDIGMGDDDDGYGDDNILGHRFGPHRRRRRHHKPEASGSFEIGFAPFVALEAYKHRRQLAKISKSSNPRAANAAKSLHKAKSGDKREQAKIKAINKRAKAGDPQAKDAMKRLKMVDAMAKKGSRGPLSKLFNEGIT